MTSPSLPRLVEVSHITKRTGEDYNETETETVEDYIESVTAEVLDEGLATWTASTAPARARVIVVDAVQRRLANPELVKQRTLSGDLEVPVDAGEGWLTDREVKVIRRLAGKPTGDSSGAVVTSSRTHLDPERRRMLRAGSWDDDQPAYVPTFPL